MRHGLGVARAAGEVELLVVGTHGLAEDIIEAQRHRAAGQAEHHAAVELVGDGRAAAALVLARKRGQQIAIEEEAHAGQHAGTRVELAERQAVAPGGFFRSDRRGVVDVTGLRTTGDQQGSSGKGTEMVHGAIFLTGKAAAAAAFARRT